MVIARDTIKWEDIKMSSKKSIINGLRSVGLINPEVEQTNTLLNQIAKSEKGSFEDISMRTEIEGRGFDEVSLSATTAAQRRIVAEVFDKPVPAHTNKHDADGFAP